MTDTGQVPGEGQPENAGGQPEQPGAPAPGVYAYEASATQGGTAVPARSPATAPGADEDDLLLMPGAQGAWGDPSAAAPTGAAATSGPVTVTHETGGRDSGAYEHGAVRTPATHTHRRSTTAGPGRPSSHRRPLHLGPPIPEQSGAVRTLADRGPSPAPTPATAVPSPTPPRHGAPAGAPPHRAGTGRHAARREPAPGTPLAESGTGAQQPPATGAPQTQPAPEGGAQPSQPGVTDPQAVDPAVLSGPQLAPLPDLAALPDPPAPEPVPTVDPTAGQQPPVGPYGGRPDAPLGAPAGPEPEPAPGTVPPAAEVAAAPAAEETAPATAGPEPAPAPVAGAGDPAPADPGVPAGPAPTAEQGHDSTVVPPQHLHTPQAPDAPPGTATTAPSDPTSASGDAQQAAPEPNPHGAPVAGQAEAATPSVAPQPVTEAPASGVAEPVAPPTAAETAPGAAATAPQAVGDAASGAPGEPAAGQAAEQSAPPAAEAVVEPTVPQQTRDGQPPQDPTAPAGTTPAEGAPEGVRQEAVAPAEVAQAQAAPEQAAPAGVVPDPAAQGEPQGEPAEAQATPEQGGPAQGQAADTSSEAEGAPDAAVPGEPQGEPAEAQATPEQGEAVAPAPETAGREQADPARNAPQGQEQGVAAEAATAPDGGAAGQAAPEQAASQDEATPAEVAPDAVVPGEPQEVPAEAQATPEGAGQAEAASEDGGAPEGVRQEAVAPAEVAQAEAAPETPAEPQADPAPTTPEDQGQEEAAEAPAAREEAERAPTTVPPEAATAPAPSSTEPGEAPTAPSSAPADSGPPSAATATVPGPRTAEAVPGPAGDAAPGEETVPPQRSAGAEATGRPPEPAVAGCAESEREALHRMMRAWRDVRDGFRADPIPDEVLLRVLEAAHTAPSVGHSQPWDFVVIRSAETRQAVYELVQRQREAYAKTLPKGRAKQFKQFTSRAVLDAPVNIVVTADPTRGGRHALGRHAEPRTAPYSSALAVENLLLAARAEGLGVGWVDLVDERELVRELGLPEHLEVVAYLCVGYVDASAEEPDPHRSPGDPRRPLSWVVHEERYGRRVLPGAEPHDLLAETLAGIRPLDAKALGEAWERQKRMTKPSGALGMLEIISAQLSGLSRKCPPPVPEPATVVVFAADHGVHDQGVTAWPQEVTTQMVANILRGGAVCNAFAAQVGAEVCVVDVGLAGEPAPAAGLLPRKVRAGTADFTTGPALTREEAQRAVEVGIETARDLVAAGNRALLTGEMGIANTTAAAALVAVFTGADPAEVTGRGTGISDEMHARKVEVVRRGLELHTPDPGDPIGVLAAFGGLEHAALTGLILGGASLRTPVVLDGVSAGAAALAARALAPEALAACIAGHRSAEPGHVAALTKLGLRPLVDLDLRLGEGTGALLALPVVQSAARAMHDVATFDTAGVTEKS